MFNNIYQYKNDLGIVKFFYGKEATLTSKSTFTGSYHFCVENEKFKINLFANKLYNNNELTEIEVTNLITLGNWLLDVYNLDQDNIYLCIKLKSINNEEFLNWWTRYNFKINVASSKEQMIKELEIKGFEEILEDLHKKGVF